MNNLKILIVEDEIMIAESLKEILENLNYVVTGIANSADEALTLLANEKPDLVTLDIQIKGDKDGIQLAEQIQSKYDIPYIYTSAFADEKTIARAKDTSPYGYLVKPYGIRDIHAAVEVAIMNFQKLQKNQIAMNQSNGVKDGNLFIKVDSRLVRLNEEDIMWVEAKGDYVIFKTEPKSFIVHSTMKNVELKLDAERFLKVHRSYIVNLDRIIDIEDSNLLIKDKVIPVSRSNKEQLMKRIQLL